MWEGYDKQPFKLDTLPQVLGDLLADGPLVADDKGRCLVSDPADPEPAVRVTLPPLAPLPPGVADAAAYLAAPRTVGPRRLVLLIQAGATSMGYWRGAELICHKVIKKYVTRGNGKAQTTYLKTRGKSRYGSRLRLQNARAHLEETCDKLARWYADYGPADAVFYSCPARLWAEFFCDEPTPPFARTDAHVFKIGMDVRKPGHDELLKVQRFLQWGAVFRKQA